MEQLLLLWIKEKQLAGDSVSEAIICEKAGAVFQDLKRDVTEKEGESLQGGEGFKASCSWFDNFKKRSSIHSVICHGEASSEDIQAAENFIKIFEKLISEEGYLPQQVFNCDETGLFWKKMPRRMFIMAEEKSLPSHKAMKDRLTLALCANAIGDFKIKPLLVYHSENKRAFKAYKVMKEKLQVLWHANSKAWVTSQFFIEWMNIVFGPSMKKYLIDNGLPLKCVLLLDNAPAQPPGLEDDPLDEFKFIKIVYLPPNTTSTLQPMDQQVISNFKKLFTKHLLKRCFKVTENTNLTLRTLNSAWRKLWPDVVLKREEFEGFEPIEEEIVSIGRSMGLEVDEAYVADLIEEYAEELTTEELKELQKISHSGEKTLVLLPFIEILQRSLSVKQHITAWCENCRRFTNMTQTKFLKSFPDILVLNCGESKPEVEFLKSQIKLLYETADGSTMKTLPDFPILRKKQCRYGSLCKRVDCRYYHEPKSAKNAQDSNQPNQSWMPSNFQLKLKGGEVVVEECSDSGENKESSDLIEENVETVSYELFAVVSVITDLQENGRDNIVSCIKVGPIGHMRHKGSAAYQWYLFNDFSIVPITAQEALYLNYEWKIPCVLYYARRDVNNRHNLQVMNPVGQQVFTEDVSLAAGSGQSHITFTPLTMEEESLPAGQLVAMDAEFVTLNQEEAEIRSDGTRSTIRPSQMSVARISCVRGDGALEGVPFIDDYISTQEQVVDYLTKFSGIQPGDLDASISSKHLTTLKATYQKLRFLIDTGVTFVGHGLKNDFRVINLVVPPAQVLDTVYLFQLPNKRMVSLRFLAWHFLDLKIQAETHDSIEDAKTALQLYKKYLELKQNGKLKDALKELYEVGRQIQWKVPGIDS
ncbi:PAN2-PAN3 deadenylation complex catalytic subunit PAN2 [Nephila pilipes]|uniref:PAN2-PAN3 deadenylation complex catalytic subunit PAN2 n=1 Tax=Nephila pilipes TaxID=299642 RepID=A0A8X6JWI4_NEPPI|nr:PAN2-PAN3 deadenylation complex catalytic subunit PAN2 [Nephila pilipes]